MVAARDARPHRLVGSEADVQRGHGRGDSAQPVRMSASARDALLDAYDAAVT